MGNSDQELTFQRNFEVEKYVPEKPLRHLLHVDFDSLASHTRILVLSDAGFAVQTVSSAVDCLQQLRASFFDAVLVHTSIRYKSGIDLVSLVKQLRPTIPVIVLDASDTPQPGADGAFCTLKSPGELLKLISEQISHSSAYSKTAG